MDARTRLTQMHAIERITARDASLFADPALAADRLGWIGSPRQALEQTAAIADFADEVAASGISDVVLLGMGGSSLAPLVLSRVFRPAPGRPVLHVLDTSSPGQVSALVASLAPSTTLVVVSSKSGTTAEPLALAAVFRAWLTAALGESADRHFIAITDPGSPLEAFARETGAARVFHAPVDVGGRYAALTQFAMVPATLSGFDVDGLIRSGMEAEAACSVDDGANPGAALAAWMADAYASGRDKLTLVASERYAPFGLWVEQLVAESTGKRGAGVLPVLEDAPGNPEAHGVDRMTFVLRAPDDEALASLPARLPAGEPVFESVVSDAAGLGGEFVRWEWAVALFSALEGIEPFDQPDVAEAKAATGSILRTETPAVAPSEIMVDDGSGALAGLEALAPALDAALAGTGSGVYLAILSYLPDDATLLAPVREAAAAVAASRGIAVTPGLGPRYLHSTGQYHKGGPCTGVFVVVTAGAPTDVPVPGKPYTLGVLNQAQAAGDIATLRRHGRPVVRIALPDAAPEHVGAVARALEAFARS